MESDINYEEQGYWRFKIFLQPPIIQFIKETTTLHDVVKAVKQQYYGKTTFYLRKIAPLDDEKEMLAKYLLLRSLNMDDSEAFGWITKVDMKPLTGGK